MKRPWVRAWTREGRRLRPLASAFLLALLLLSAAGTKRTVYLLPLSNDKVRPILEKQLKKGTRIVAHDFEFKDWKPEKVESIEDDGEGRSHTLYLYRR